MSDCMMFPDTVEEFMGQYKVVDTEHIYSNGMELVPIFRMKQWFEHLPSAEPEEYTIEMQEADIDEAIKHLRNAKVTVLPSAEPKRKSGKWREYPIADGMNQCSECGVLRFGESNYCPNCGADMRGGDAK